MKGYCLDANFFIVAWNGYYSRDFCLYYWDIIAELGEKGIVFIPEEVKREIEQVDDTLNSWLIDKKYMVKSIDDDVQKALKTIYEKDPKHKRLVDTKKGRSKADPWVIAHAMATGTVVVTKEIKITSPSSSKIQIPNVCENMGVECIDDFQFIKEQNIKFKAIHEST